MLSERLSAVFALTAPGSAADIGTDHGYLAAEYVRSGKFSKVIASDIAPDPLRKAVEYAKSLGIEDRVEFRLGDGLTVLAPGEVDTAVIAGVGGETAASMVCACPFAAEGLRLIFQPMSRPDVLRRTLFERGLMITAERFVKENGRIFSIICAEGGKPEALSPAEELVGKLSKNDPLFEEYRQWVMGFTAKALRSVRNGESAKERERELSELLDELQKL